MKLYVKYMVSLRCKALVEEELKKVTGLTASYYKQIKSHRNKLRSSVQETALI